MGGLGIKKKKKKKKQQKDTCFLKQASNCAISYLIQSKFLLPFLQSVIRFCTLTSKNSILICLGEISILGYKVGKLSFSSPGCV